ncbi:MULTISPECIES: GNAT family N-acetyltransferase [Haloferax]|uniref:GNAT family N-acetyltransferase n=1 Tax=Haloferax marinum TaxID=2666143 RepID=A0A6A8G9Z3_9EURY|nr:MULTISPECIES: GNAT family protein [Haloferax]KAB1198434.1 GNAT family N-acetyltransferase [Haloferax sp. CBA1150]MRW97535.1 GNAT family N-acetyltransferase [Haloferax marinum]
MFPDEIVTPRLRLRALSREGVDPLEAYDYFAASRSDTIEEETKFVTWNPHQTPKEAFDFFRDAEEAHEKGENAIYAIFPREGEPGAGEFVGTAGFKPEWDLRRAVFGMWLRKKYWGRGYSGERAAAFFATIFDVLDLEVALAYAMPENEPSCRAISKYTERFGGQEDGLFRNDAVDADGTPRDVRGWSVTREQWLEATGGEYDAEFSWEGDGRLESGDE